jgi:hypothetical protein
MAEPASRPDPRPWIVGCCLLAILALHAVSDPRPPDGVWGAVGALAFSQPVRWVLLVMAALLALPPVSRRVVRAGAPLVRRAGTALGGIPTWVWIALLVAVTWLLRSRTLSGDGPATIDLLQNGELINFKEPLDRLVTALVYRAGYAVVGWDAGTAIALVSVAAGALFWAGLLRLARLRPLDGAGGWVVWALVGTTGATQLFFGHVENYSLLTAGTLWTLVLSLEAATDPARPLWPAGLAFGLTFATHLSAAWLAAVPPVTWLQRRRQATGGRWRERAGPTGTIGEAARGALVACIPIALVAAGMLVAGVGLGGFSMSGFGGGDGRLFVPLFRVETPYERFTMFSRAHLAAFGNELLLVAPVGVVLALTLWLGRRRDGGRTDAGTWVLLGGALGTVTYAFAFNPDMMVANPALGVMNEWDLFAFEAIPITLLGVWWLRTALDPGDERDALVLSAAATSLVHTAGWLLLNAGVVL